MSARSIAANASTARDQDQPRVDAAPMRSDGRSPVRTAVTSVTTPSSEATEAEDQRRAAEAGVQAGVASMLRIPLPVGVDPVRVRRLVLARCASPRRRSPCEARRRRSMRPSHHDRDALLEDAARLAVVVHRDGDAVEGDA